MSTSGRSRPLEEDPIAPSDSGTETIPGPSGLPVVGNLLQLPRDGAAMYLAGLAPLYDGIFSVDFAGKKALFASSPQILEELSDEARFRKVVVPPLSHVRALAGDGLFTARSDEENWAKAHHVLMPAFSLRAMKSYFEAMLHVAQELVDSWDRRQGEDLAVTDDMTRLTLDTIALTGFGQRFESFRTPELHPFLGAMGRVLADSQAKLSRLPGTERLYARRDRRVQADIDAMNRLVDGVVAARKAGSEPGEDLLGLMLEAVDPASGERLSDVNVRYQILTFLIAGHETTSGLLSFAVYQLLRNPQVLAQAYAEVDQLFPGDTVPTYRDVNRLDVLSRALDETLRLWSPAPGYTVAPFEPTMLAGKYPLGRNRPVNVLIPALHRDPAAWPEPDRFDIDRFLPEVAAARQERYPHAYKPFGNGARACIGRQFALIEAKLALALVLQRFALEDAYDYKLNVKQALTIKPEGFRIRARRRRPHERLGAAASTQTETAAQQPTTELPVISGAGVGVALAVLHGSSMGTCEDLANTVAERGEAAGFSTTLRSLDDALDDLPTSGFIVVVTSTYNGAAPDNACRFDAAISEGRFSGELAGKLANVEFSLLGCGNTQWATYQAFPKRLELALLEAGAQPLIARSEADAAGDFDGDVQQWSARLLAAVAERYGAATFGDEPSEPRYAVQLLDERAVRPTVVPERAGPLVVVSNEELLGDPTGLWDHELENPLSSTRHVVLELPEESAGYEVGDHLAVYAKNAPDLVARAAARFGLSPQQIVRLEQRHGRGSHLPVGTPVDVARLLGEFVELQDVATRADIRLLAGHAEDPADRARLTALGADTSEGERAYREAVLDRHVSLLDLLEALPSVRLPLEIYLDRCLPIRARYYSISSSPLSDPRRPSLTVGVLESQAWSGTGQYKGLTSNFVRRLQPGDTVFGYVRTPTPAFLPPSDPTTPMVLIGPGTGVAPFRGFLQDRAARRDRGDEVGRALMLLGCRHPDHDWYYRGEMQNWAERGLVELHPAFSSLAGHPHRFVQHALAAAGDTVWELLETGGHLYLCGDGLRMAPAVRSALLELHLEQTGGTEAQAEAWLATLRETGRYAEDVFAPSK